MLLFVYGSLKKGCSLHDEYMRGARFIRKDRAPGYTLYLSEDGYPLMVKEEGGVVEGEVWEVDGETLKRIREMEEEDGYVLREVELEGGRALAFVYPRELLKGERKIGGFWEG